jgi:hypothetical protein
MKRSLFRRWRCLRLSCLALAGLAGAGVATGWAASYAVTQTQHARPASIQFLLPALNAGDASYTFEVVLMELRSKGGLTQVRTITTVTKTGDGKTVRVKDIAQAIQPEATQFSVTADGREFVFEATYTEPTTTEGVQPREIQTTFLQMFGGGPVGIRVRAP